MKRQSSITSLTIVLLIWFGLAFKCSSNTTSGGAPTAGEVKETIEKSFTNIYRNHFYGVRNEVTFKWAGSISIGELETRRQAPAPCYPVKLQVQVTATDPRDGNTSTVARGINANIGGYLKNEVFCFFKNGSDDWEFGIYEQ
jgi:hypothetical protein